MHLYMQRRLVPQRWSVCRGFRRYSRQRVNEPWTVYSKARLVTSHEEDDHQELDKNQASILAILEREGVRLVVAQDAVRNPSAVLVFDQLMTTIEDLHRDLEQANDACKRVENQLVATRKKHPASSPFPQQGEIDYCPRKV